MSYSIDNAHQKQLRGEIKFLSGKQLTGIMNKTQVDTSTVRFNCDIETTCVVLRIRENGNYIFQE